MEARDQQQKGPLAGGAWVRLKLMQIQHEGVSVGANLIPSLTHDDILQIRPVGSKEHVFVQYKKNLATEVRTSKDRCIMVCSRVFQNRKDTFPQRGEVEVRKVDKESVGV